MSVVVEFRRGKHPRIKCYWTKLWVRTYYEKYSSYSVITGISFYDYWNIRNPVHKHWSGRESFLECFKRLPTIFSKVPSNPLAGKTGEQNYDVQVIENKLTVEICESEEKLNILNFLRFWPINNGLDLLRWHGQAIWRYEVTKVLNGCSVECALDLPASPTIHRSHNVFRMQLSYPTFWTCVWSSVISVSILLIDPCMTFISEFISYDPSYFLIHFHMLVHSLTPLLTDLHRLASSI
jgi:hypothetical protein